MRWNIGDGKVTLIREVLLGAPFDGIVIGWDEDTLRENALWLKPYMGADGSMTMSIQAFVIEAAGDIILIDPCIGTRHMPGHPLSDLQSSFLSDLSAAGYGPEVITKVLCTHLHYDHVGWNTRLLDGMWVPTFPNARYLFGRCEYEHWLSTDHAGAHAHADAVTPVVDAGLVDLVEMDHRINECVWLEPTPGHTPGHVSVRLSSRARQALVTGDMVHHPVQVAAPQWSVRADGDRVAASAMRDRFRVQYANSGIRIFGTHFASTSTGFVEHDNAFGFRFVDDQSGQGDAVTVITAAPEAELPLLSSVLSTLDPAPARRLALATDLSRALIVVESDYLQPSSSTNAKVGVRQWDLIQSSPHHRPGPAVLVLQLEVDASDDDQLNRWYESEHFQETLDLAGVRSGRRFRARDDPHAYLCLFELDDEQLLASAAFLGRQPTDWTKRMSATVQRPQRGVWLDVTAEYPPELGIRSLFD